MMKPCHS